MKLLAIETSTDACSVALRVGDEVLSDHRVVAQQHGALILPMINTLMSTAGLAPSQLDGLVYGRGPGSFTGVRIGVACAQGIALGADLGVVGVSTLQSIAQGIYRRYDNTAVAVCVDARMDEVYFCHYQLSDSGAMQPLVAERISAPEDIDTTDMATWAGSGAERYKDVLQLRSGTTSWHVHDGALPEAVDLLSLGALDVLNGDLQSAEKASPVYLRNKVALTTAERMEKLRKE